MKSNTQEIEATFIIRSENPHVLTGQIANLSSIANYQLLLQDSEEIHDRYFDTSDGKLKNQKLALRVREIDTKFWITLKGGSKRTDWGGLQRLEIEAPWSYEALKRVIQEIKERNIKLLQQDLEFAFEHPIDVLTHLGLKIIQDRETYRKIRNIVTMGEKNRKVIAELAIDLVKYHFSNQEVFHHELEIEAKMKNGLVMLKNIIEKLVTTFGPELRLWKHGKLVTGKAIEKLLSEGTLIGMLDENNYLKPIAYDIIEEYLNSGNF
ncbi:MAG: CYTH domain-containing protein [bacterium]